MGKYDIDMKRLAVLLLPTALRQPRLSALAQVLMAPLSRLHREFITYREAKDYRLRHNGQACYLRAALNDRFDKANRRIYIDETGNDYTTPLIFPREDMLPLVVRNRDAEDYNGDPLPQTLLFRRGFGGTDSIDFWVCIPQELRTRADYSEDEVRAVTSQYKLASKRFGITYF